MIQSSKNNMQEIDNVFAVNENEMTLSCYNQAKHYEDMKYKSNEMATSFIPG